MVKVIGESPEVFKQVSCSHCEAKLQYTAYPGETFLEGQTVESGLCALTATPR